MNESTITKDELIFILEFIHARLHLFIENGVSPYRNLLKLNSLQNLPNLFFDIKKRILNRENIFDEYIDDFLFGDYVGYITDGGKIHYHTDDTIPGYDHVRFNLFLCLPKKGGLPIYNGVTIPVRVGDCIRCNSSKEFHECEMVEGDRPRIVLSYGIHLKNNDN